MLPGVCQAASIKLQILKFCTFSIYKIHINQDVTHAHCDCCNMDECCAKVVFNSIDKCCVKIM